MPMHPRPSAETCSPWPSVRDSTMSLLRVGDRHSTIHENSDIRDPPRARARGFPRWCRRTVRHGHTASIPGRRAMRGAILYAPGDVRVDERDDPTIVESTDAVIRLSATCVCGSDLWPYRGIEVVDGPSPMGHEYVGIVEEVGSDVRTV